MESFALVDLFETQGMEYLVAIGSLAAFVVYWRFLNRPASAVARAETADAVSEARSAWFNLADGLHYHQGHSWAALDGESPGIVRVGVDDFAHKLLGKLDRIELPAVGAELSQGEKGWALDVDSKVFGLLSPVSGRVVEVNQDVLAAPDLAARDPYQRGWLVKVEVPRLEANLTNLLAGGLAQVWMNETEDRLRTAMAGELGVLLQDGGEPLAGIAKQISPEKWDELARSYLLSPQAEERAGE